MPRMATRENWIGTISLLGSNDGTFGTNTTAIPLAQANYNIATTAVARKTSAG